jgi:hypothetical protein
MMVVGAVGWLISIVVFVVAVDYIASRIDRVGDEAAETRNILNRIDSYLSNYIKFDPHEKSERELAELNQTVLGGLTALIAIASHVHGVDRQKMTNEQCSPARATITDFVGSYWSFSGWKRETENGAADLPQFPPEE